MLACPYQALGISNCIRSLKCLCRLETKRGISSREGEVRSKGVQTRYRNIGKCHSLFFLFSCPWIAIGAKSTLGFRTCTLMLPLHKCCHGVLLRYPYTKCSSKSCVSTICSIYSVQLLLLCVFVFLTLWYQYRSHSGIFHKRAAQPVGTGRLIFPLPLHPVRTKDICIGLIVLAIFLGPGFVFVIPDRHGHLCVD